VAGDQSAPVRQRQSIRYCRETELAVHLRRRGRDERPEQDGQDAAGLGQVVEHFVEPLRLRRVLRQLERRGVVHVLVRPVHDGPDADQRRLKFVGFQVGDRLADCGADLGSEFVRPPWDRAVAIPLEHRQRTIDEVAQTVGELARVAA